MKQSTYLFFSALAMLVFSCNCNDDDAAPNQPLATDYFPLTVGSYWIYHWYVVDTLGNETPHSVVDTVSITGETVINGHTYAKFEGTQFRGKFEKLLRDSSGYIVEANGSSIEFTINPDVIVSNDTTFLGNAPLFWIEDKMTSSKENIEVPAGSFPDCLEKQRTVYPLEFESPYGARTYPYYYAKGVGLVQQLISYFSSPEYIEGRLVEYHVN